MSRIQPAIVKSLRVNICEQPSKKIFFCVMGNKHIHIHVHTRRSGWDMGTGELDMEGQLTIKHANFQV